MEEAKSKYNKLIENFICEKVIYFSLFKLYFNLLNIGIYNKTANSTRTNFRI